MTRLLFALLLATSPVRETVETIAQLVDESYVDEAAAHRIAADVRKHLAAGDYDALVEPELIQRLTADLRAAGNDEHLEVTVRMRPPVQPQPQTNDWLEPLRRRNFDFIRAERLDGNVGYLQLDSFPPPNVAGDTAAAAMRFLSNSDALIIDLRQNSGGSGEMVGFLATYFFDERTTLLRTYRRRENRITDDTTLPWVPGPRMPSIKLFLLVSHDTFSAAEAFAFALQQNGRAVVVGERTRGGANAGRHPDGARDGRNERQELGACRRGARHQGGFERRTRRSIEVS